MNRRKFLHSLAIGTATVAVGIKLGAMEALAAPATLAPATLTFVTPNGFSLGCYIRMSGFVDKGLNGVYHFDRDGAYHKVKNERQS